MKYDAFADVLQSYTGALGGDALVAFDKATTVANEEGLQAQMACRGCGRPAEVTAYWPEVIAIKYELSPHQVFSRVPQLQRFASQWTRQKSGGDWLPMGLRCSKCNEELQPLYAPRECDMHLTEARRAGWLDPATNPVMSGASEKQISDVCYQASLQTNGGAR